MSCSRTSRLAASVLLLAAALLTVGCEDDLRDPSMAEVEIRFRSDSPALRQGAEVWLDGEVLTSSLSVSAIDTLLSAGMHTFVVRKDCVEVSPAETLVVEIEGGRPATIDFEMSLRCGLLALRVRSGVEGLALGSRIWIDGELTVDSLAVEEIELLLEPGPHTVEIEKECASVAPADSFLVEIEAAQTHEVDVDVSSQGVLSVTSQPSGLAVSLNGEDTGFVTPAAFPCIDPDTYEIAVHPRAEVGFLVVGDTLQTVTVAESGETNVEFTIALIPIPQSRGVLLELFTATWCPNCPVAEEVLETIEHDPAYPDETVSTAEMHVRWGGTDPFYNEHIANRIDYYGVEANSAPIASFNGLDHLVGSSNPDLEAAYRARIGNTYDQPAKAGLYWEDVRVEGDLLRGDLRFVAIEDLSEYESLRLFVFYTKDELPATQYPGQQAHFSAVVREIQDLGALDGQDDVTPAGSYKDFDVTFDLAADAEWPTPSIRLCAIVQEGVSKEILQCREVRLDLR